MFEKEGKERLLLLTVSLLIIGSIATYGIFSGGFRTFGMAYSTANPDDIQDQLSGLLERMPFTVGMGDGVRLCVLVKIDNETTYSYNIDKVSYFEEASSQLTGMAVGDETPADDTPTRTMADDIAASTPDEAVLPDETPADDIPSDDTAPVNDTADDIIPESPADGTADDIAPESPVDGTADDTPADDSIDDDTIDVASPPDIQYRYIITKTDSLYCDGFENEDMIIKFNSYEDFLTVYYNPSCKNLVASQANAYYILPSKYVATGGQVTCDKEFKEKFCSAISGCWEAALAMPYGLSCCFAEEIVSISEQAIGGTGPAANLAANRTSTTAIFTTQLKRGSPMILLAVLIGITILGTVTGISMSKKRKVESKQEAAPTVNSQMAPRAMPPRHPFITVVPHRPIQMPRYAGPQMKSGPGPAGAEDPSLTQLKSYISSNLSRGIDRGAIRQKLISTGWRAELIDRYLKP